MSSAGLEIKARKILSRRFTFGVLNSAFSIFVAWWMSPNRFGKVRAGADSGVWSYGLGCEGLSPAPQTSCHGQLVNSDGGAHLHCSD